MTIDPRILHIANTHLTEKQADAWLLHQQGCSIRYIAYHLDISRTTAGDRIDSAWRTLRKHGIIATPDGRPHLAEQEPA
jgi:DNA-directed RNA polymerase specialized sigma24 family protein